MKHKANRGDRPTTKGAPDCEVGRTLTCPKCGAPIGQRGPAVNVRGILQHRVCQPHVIVPRPPKVEPPKPTPPPGSMPYSEAVELWEKLGEHMAMMGVRDLMHVPTPNPKRPSATLREMGCLLAGRDVPPLTKEDAERLGRTTIYSTADWLRATSTLRMTGASGREYELTVHGDLE